MERELDLTPEVNSRNFNNIIDIVTALPFTKSKDIASIQSVLATKSAQQLSALNRSLVFLSAKESLTSITVDFFLETPYIELIDSFLTWSTEIIIHKPELLEITNKLSRIVDLKKIMNRLEQLKIERIVNENLNYDFLFSLIELIENELDELGNIQFLSNKISRDLLKQLIKLSFFNCKPDLTICIENSCQYNIVLDFICNIKKLKQNCEKNSSEFRPVKRTLGLLDRLLFIINAEVLEQITLPLQRDIFKFKQHLKPSQILYSDAFLSFINRRLSLLGDGLIDFHQSRKKSFAEFSYFVNTIFPQAQRLSFFLKNNNFIKTKRGLKAVCATPDVKINNKPKPIELGCLFDKKNNSLFFQNVIFIEKNTSFNQTLDCANIV